MPEPPRHALKDIDSVERAYLIKIAVRFGGPCFILLSLAWFSCLARDWISPAVFVLLMILNIPLTVALVFAIDRGTTKASSQLMKTIYSAGDIPPPRTYPRQDMLIIRGNYVEAAEYFRDHLVVEPGDNEARLRLADLLERHLADPAGAERLYFEVRRTFANPREEMAAANGLIDLYRKTGQRGRLMAELARFAGRYAGSPQGDEAARALREMKEQDHGGGPPTPPTGASTTR